MASSAETAARVYVARQPILDLNERVFGYELLYRQEATDRSCVGDGDTASGSVLTGALLDLGLDTLTGGRQAFLSLTRPLLLGHIDTLVAPEEIVIEVLGNITIDDDVIEACRALHEKGYRLALDDFVPGSEAEALFPYVSFVKVDVLSTPIPVAQSLPKQLEPHGIGLLAEKVDTRAVYHRMRIAGYTLFQGFYFCGPMLQEAVALSAQKLAYLRLLAALNTPDLATTDVERLVKQDVSLSLRVLRSVNSAAYPIRTDVHSIGHALLLVGVEPIRRWASVWCLAGLSTTGTPELATLALLRARACELAARRLSDVESSELFLVGLFSLLDVMLSTPMAAAIEMLPLSDGAKHALTGGSNTLRTVLDAVVHYERGSWDEAMATAAPVGVDAACLADAYTGALRWVEDVTRGA
jgi:EAL and modified HD-GYP domain-containing signal transduction protein